MMEKQRVNYDTITIMESYNFHRPIKTSIIYEVDDIKPDHITDPEENNFISKNLQNNQILCHALDQKDLYTKNGTMHNTGISPYHRFYDSGTEVSKQGFNSCHKYMLPKSTMNTYPFMGNLLINGSKANLNNNSTVKKSALYNSNINKTVFLNQVAENLALIIADYVHYYNFSNTSCNKQHLAQLKSQCLLRKLHFFKKCSIFDELLIQYENNIHFIRSLTNKIKQFAKVTFPYNLLSILFKDLLDWIKINKNQKANIFQQKRKTNESASSSSQAESSLPISNGYLENGNHNRSYTNIFSDGPPGNRIAISVDPQILTQVRTESNAYQESYTTETNVPNQNLHYPSIAKTSNIERRIHTTEHHIPQTYYAYTNGSNQHNIQRATSSTTPLNYNSMYFAETRLNSRDGFHDDYNYINNSSSYSDVNLFDTQDVTRNSISRDSGFTSPVTSVSPSEPMYNNNLYPPTQGVYDASIFNVPNTTTIDRNIGQEALPVLNDFQLYP